MSSTPPPSGPGGYSSYPGLGGEQPGSPYGASPGPADVPQPASVRTAVRLMWVGGGLSLVGLAVSLATLGGTTDDIRRQLREDDPNMSQSAIDAAVTIGIGSAVVGGVIGAALWAWMAWKNGQGRSWARVVATVLAGINIVFTLGGLALGGTQTFAMVVSLINLALAVVILVLLWRKDSSEFFAAHSAQKYA
ncbi:hypothetical protein [Aeromicrobium yanjiei]|uniref:Uncharacterized protein n=1 Tax=Aeromicrobium yanjiei TaxID=2662028 RepID=A0A5Q2MR68_9ACTN|nr:hypothetical protein [Aeromicrobium yanjiei]QGG42990.1 hypothetical protein GEV26_17300 [Aeromicrobium yanjiei]